jgi:DNA-binding protein HU-beta
MNKNDLITIIADKSDLSRKKADIVLSEIINAITETLKAKDKVTLIGFGTFETAERAARVGRNPKTGEEIKIKATTAAKFRPGKALKSAIAGIATAKVSSKSDKKTNVTAKPKKVIKK